MPIHNFRSLTEPVKNPYRSHKEGERYKEPCSECEAIRALDACTMAAGKTVWLSAGTAGAECRNWSLPNKTYRYIMIYLMRKSCILASQILCFAPAGLVLVFSRPPNESEADL